eukprot:GEMP01038599.1.p1 GENE.GEMP01038599.1~~GEMP01038599.1.p1  ORF type:complete len:158 (+),score=21.15 GEMP01038599.1:243-716(+)
MLTVDDHEPIALGSFNFHELHALLQCAGFTPTVPVDVSDVPCDSLKAKASGFLGFLLPKKPIFQDNLASPQVQEADVTHMENISVTSAENISITNEKSTGVAQGRSTDVHDGAEDALLVNFGGRLLVIGCFLAVGWWFLRGFIRRWRQKLNPRTLVL